MADEDNYSPDESGYSYPTTGNGYWGGNYNTAIDTTHLKNVPSVEAAKDYQRMIESGIAQQRALTGGAAGFLMVLLNRIPIIGEINSLYSNPFAKELGARKPVNALIDFGIATDKKLDAAKALSDKGYAIVTQPDGSINLVKTSGENVTDANVKSIDTIAQNPNAKINIDNSAKNDPLIQEVYNETLNTGGAPGNTADSGYSYERAIVDYGRTKGLSRYDSLQNQDALVQEMKAEIASGKANPYTNILSRNPMEGTFDGNNIKPSGTEQMSSYYWEHPEQLDTLKNTGYTNALATQLNTPAGGTMPTGSNVSGVGMPRTAQDVFNSMIDNFYGVGGGKSYKQMLDEDAAYQKSFVQGKNLNISAGGSPFFSFVPKQAYTQAEFTSPNRSGLSYQSALNELYGKASGNDPYVKPKSTTLADILALLNAGTGTLKDIYPYLQNNASEGDIDSSLSNYFGDYDKAVSNYDTGTTNTIDFETDDSWQDWDLY